MIKLAKKKIFLLYFLLLFLSGFSFADDDNNQRISEPGLEVVVGNIKQDIENKNPESAFRVFMENIHLFPSFASRNEYQEIKVRILKELLKQYVSNTLPTKISEYINQGNISALIQWINNKKARATKLSRHHNTITIIYYTIAYMYATGLKVEKNNTVAVNYIQKLYTPRVKNGGLKGRMIYELALMMRYYIDPAIISYRKGMRLLATNNHYNSLIGVNYIKDSASMNYMPAQVKLALMLRNGEYMEKSPRVAFALMMEVAETPVNNIDDRERLNLITRAQAEVADMYLNEKDIKEGMLSPMSVEKALKWVSRGFETANKTTFYLDPAIPEMKEHALAGVEKLRKYCQLAFSR